MSRKTSVLYSKIVDNFQEIFQFNVSGIVTDFEEALFQSFSNGFPGAVATRCLFHYKKATYKTGILRNGLANLYYSNQEFKSWFQQLMNLPLLHSDKITETLFTQRFSTELLHSDKKKMTVFLHIMRDNGYAKSVRCDFLYFKMKNERLRKLSF